MPSNSRGFGKTSRLFMVHRMGASPFNVCVSLHPTPVSFLVFWGFVKSGATGETSLWLLPACTAGWQEHQSTQRQGCLSSSPSSLGLVPLLTSLAVISYLWVRTLNFGSGTTLFHCHLCSLEAPPSAQGLFPVRGTPYYRS